jgi:hypothetical protein
MLAMNNASHVCCGFSHTYQTNFSVKAVTVHDLFINMSPILQRDSKVPAHLYEKKYSHSPRRTYTLAVTHYDKFWRWIQHTSHMSRIAVKAQERRGADKSLAPPGRKQATSTKLGIYSTYSLRSGELVGIMLNKCSPNVSVRMA